MVLYIKLLWKINQFVDFIKQLLKATSTQLTIVKNSLRVLYGLVVRIDAATKKIIQATLYSVCVNFQHLKEFIRYGTTTWS